ncbi:hypothetical protein J3R83DRAFT_5739 [Lanmaoa asiatica]|nr:hypothetical protein J3R83DRAFT_5739 [Lanmaoa asiatica]
MNGKLPIFEEDPTLKFVSIYFDATSPATPLSRVILMMPVGAPYHSFALPYPIRVDSFTDTIDDLPPPYNRPPLHLLTHTHSDHIAGLASKSFAYRVICSPDAKEMLLRHEVYAERSFHDHDYRAEKKKTFGHLKVDPTAIPLNTPTEFDISDSETVTITLIDANHCPGSVMFLIEGPRGTVLHTGDLRAEPCSSGDLRILVARREGTHAEATGLVKTLEAIYLDTACLLSPIVVPSKERAAQGIVELIALFPSSTYFFINAWTWGYEDVLKAIAHEFHCKVHLDRYKHSIYLHGSDPFLRALGTRDAASTRFHACERFDRCSFVDVPPYDYGAKGALAPPSKEGKKVVYVNAVNMSCARWEDYQVGVRRRVLKGENVGSLLVPLSRHSPLPELMNFVTLFRPLRVVPNTLDPSLNGLDWGAMSKIFSGCLAPVSTPGHLSVTSLPVPSTKYDPRTLSATVGEEHTDTAYSNVIGPRDAAEQWGDKGGKKARMEVLRAWIGTERQKGLGRTRRRIDEDAVLEKDTDERGLAAGPSRLASSSGGSDDHARTAWTLFGVGELEDACKTWTSPSPQSQSQARAKTVVDIGTLPTPTSSPLLHDRQLEGSDKGKERAIECASQSGPALTMPANPLGRAPTEIVFSPVNLDPSRPTSFVSACTSPFVSFDDIRFSGPSLEEQTNEAVGSGSQPFACLDNVILSDPSQDIVPSRPLTQHRSQSKQTPWLHRRNLSITQEVHTRVGPGDRRRAGEKDDVPELAGGKLAQVQNAHTTPCGREEICGLSHKPSIGLTRISAPPSVASKDDKEASLPPMPSPRSSPAPARTAAVTAAATISFPVRKRVEHRVGKTASLSVPGYSASSPRTGIRQELGPGLALCSISAITRTSTVVDMESTTTHVSVTAPDTSTRISDAPVSPRTAARRAERAERRRITEKLRLARPDLVRVPASRRGSRALERARTEWTSGRGEVSAGHGMGVTEEDDKMDWQKSQGIRVMPSSEQEPIILYDIPSITPGRPWSPNTMKTRYCLGYKQLPFTTVWVEFPDIAGLLQSKGVTHPPYTLPAIEDPNTGAFIMDSLAIATVLGRDVGDMFSFGSSRAGELGDDFAPRLVFLILCGERLNPVSKAYYYQTRAARLGERWTTLVDACSASPEDRAERVSQGIEAIRGVWHKVTALYVRQSNSEEEGQSGGPFVLGEEPSFLDFTVAGRVKFALDALTPSEAEMLMSLEGGRLGRLVEDLERYYKY